MPAGPQTNPDDVIDPTNHMRRTLSNLEGDKRQAPHQDRDDRDNLQGLDDEIDDIIQRKRRQNTLVRFNQLPLEIASKILWLSIVDSWWRRRSCSFIQRLRIISSVCSSWRSVVESSPRFWSIIDFSSPQRTISDLLRKSGSSALEIKCFSDGRYDCTARLGITGYLNLIAPHTFRIQSLILSTVYSDASLKAILQSPAPILEELRINFLHRPFVRPLDLFCGQAGRLRDVALENIPFRWGSAVLAGLKSLKIRRQFDNRPSRRQVRRLLVANPGLETMDIEDVRVEDPEWFMDDAVEPRDEAKPTRVVMKEMKELRLVSLPFELVQTVLDNIEIPSIKYFDLKCLFRGQPASTLLGPNIKHLVPPLLQGSQGTHLAEITFGRTSVGLEIYGRRQDPDIRIELENTTPMSGFGWLAENLFVSNGLPAVCKTGIFQVSLKFGDDFDMAGGAFIPILDRLAAVKVKALTIECTCRNGQRLINYLGEPNEDSQWPLPHLTALTIGGREELADYLLSALQHRKDVPPVGALVPLRPVMLELLDLEALDGMNRKVKKALAKCVSSSGTFIRDLSGLGDDWEDFDDDEEEEETWNGSESGVIYSPVEEAEDW